MFKKFFNRSASGLGGEIFREKKRRERVVLTVLGIIALLILNGILYLISSR